MMTYFLKFSVLNMLLALCILTGCATTIQYETSLNLRGINYR